MGSEAYLVALEICFISPDVRFGSLDGRLMTSEGRLMTSEGGLVTSEAGLVTYETKYPCFLTICAWFEKAESTLASSFVRWKFFLVL